MLLNYSFQDGQLVLDSSGSPKISIYNNPDNTERNFLIEKCGLDEHTLASSTDPDETPRIEFEDDHVAIIIKYPKNYSAEDNYFFHVKSMGVFVFPATSSIIIVLKDEHYIFSQSRLAAFKCKSVQQFLLRLLSQIIRHFEDHLHTIKLTSDELELEISGSMDNRNLQSMFTLAKGLVYYQNALNGNQRLMERMRSSSMLNIKDQNLEQLDDLMIENQQFLDQSKIYYQVLGGLLEARASIINNNLNVMMKNMNAIVIAISIPTFFTGVGGMSEFTALFAGKLAWYFAYPLFCGVMIATALVIYWLIQRAYRSQ